MKSVNQINIENYHDAIETMHPGHNMHVMHRNWHANNPDPTAPTSLNPDWGVDLIFGTNFLQMHHERVKATSSEPHQHMMHSSVVEWYLAEGLLLPPTWNPLLSIPEELQYEPDPSVYPDEMAQKPHDTGFLSTFLPDVAPSGPAPAALPFEFHQLIGFHLLSLLVSPLLLISLPSLHHHLMPSSQLQLNCYHHHLLPWLLVSPCLQQGLP